MEELTIRLFDRDHVFDDRLGATQTDAKGEFEIVYRTQDFHDLFEGGPDLYLKVLDHEGNLLYSSRGIIEAGVDSTQFPSPPPIRAVSYA